MTRMITCDHPDLPGQPISVPESVVPGHRALGWVPRRPGDDPDVGLVGPPAGDPDRTEPAPGGDVAQAEDEQPAGDADAQATPAAAPPQTTTEAGAAVPAKQKG